MYDNIGGKIKGLAKVLCVILAIADVIIGIAIMTTESSLVALGFLIMVVGPVIAWISSWLLYGFGELIVKTSDIERNTRGGERKPEAQAKVDSERTDKIEKLRSQGLINEEEYRQAISKIYNEQ